MKRLSVLHQFLDTVKGYNLIEEKSRVLIGVSGGADSVGLADLLKLVREKWQLELFAIHINHRLRSTAQQDEDFVRELMTEWQIPLTVVRVNVADYARRHKLGIEAAGRKLRYYHYQRVARKLDCQRVALGHNADDNLETVILNLVRGAGMRGVAGIPIWRGIFVRPLLKLRREAIRSYLQAREIKWMEDETNQDERFMRNIIRQEVVPVLERINPAAVENVSRGTEIIAAEDLFLDFLATRILERIAKFSGRWATIDIEEFNSYNNVLKRRMLRQLFPELDAEMITGVIALIEKRKRGMYHLKGTLALTIKDRVLTVPVCRLQVENGD